jgi:GntR family uxuAB operon transcriptional repressor
MSDGTALRPRGECGILVAVDESQRAGVPTGTGEAPDRRRYLEVAEEVMRAVAVDAIGPGDRLPNERVLAERCEVSRATVREAMLALELSGVIEVRPGSGSYLTGLGVHSGNAVAPPADSSPRQLLEVRQIIEPSVARLCAERARKADIRRLEQMIDDAGRESKPGTPGHLDRFVAHSLAFHRELATCCGNSILAGLTSHLVNAAEHPLWTLVDGIVVRDPEIRAKQLEEHRAILRAISRGHGDGAAEAMTAHLGALATRIFGPERPASRVTRTRRGRTGAPLTRS